MTTFSSYVDAAISRDAATVGRLRWLASPARQRVVLLLGDGLTLTAAILIAAPIAASAGAEAAEEVRELLRLAAPMLVAGWLAMLHAFGANELRHLRAGPTEYKRLLTASVATAGLVAVVSYLLRLEFSRVFYLLAFGLGTTGLVVTRYLRRQAMSVLHRDGLLTTPVVVVGDSGHVDCVAQVLRRETWLGYRVVGAITSDRVKQTASGVPALGRVQDAEQLIAKHQVRTVIFAEGSFASPAEFRRMAWRLEEHDVHMVVVPALTDISAQRLEVRPVAGLPLVDVDRPRAVAATRWIKRSFDVAGAAVLLVLAAPLLAVAALAIKLEDGGPVIFRQTRVGRKGEHFECLKFRSMVLDAEARLAELAAHNEGAGPLFKMTRDPRITRVGRVIRRFSIDELPQLWNALRGDMSLIGPRPALPAEVAQYDQDTRRRLDVRPGLTGLWQVSGRSNLSWEDTVRLDLYYVDNWSMTQDLLILARTAKAVLGSAGAY